MIVLHLPAHRNIVNVDMFMCIIFAVVIMIMNNFVNRIIMIYSPVTLAMCM